MYITKILTDFLTLSQSLSNSTILLTDTEKVILCLFDKENNKIQKKNNDYLNKTISDSLKQILNLYNSDINTIDYMNTTMDSIIPLVVNDDVSNYRSQIILPITHDCSVEGLLIFITDDREYLPSNLKFAKTTKHFVELFSSKRYL